MTPSDILELHHIRKTLPRMAIIEVLQESTAPLSEADIKQGMGKLYDRITFYRNVQTMLEAGILHRIIIDNTQVRYALNHCDEHHCHHQNHLHFYCKKCNGVTCLDAVLAASQLVPEGYEADEIEVLIQGTCKNCKELESA
ncbi:Fur family transcriptional regulator [Mangrovibacterium diazotrophicum]|uniref:Fur family ferric uptake transcriptional regulator n=1 Tax=Mangrovibacterium diazotrophicum TaxID=1261403 RepID=A0A419W8P1_9BACT|nr:transcriptional repressor [Mangrovibacterium diazotrophicum]RKD91825.1 Fur family ferric uptake transcriptional regulator [Mangrovibacterium diazotrophicum]